ncbi:hypothetical protein KKG52_02145 [Patescibacteria group bacterium]|nr:hypothetical protein [Patescibacteria group bacterium]
MNNTGIAFGDFIFTEKNKRKRRDYDEKNRAMRELFLIICLVVGVSVLLLKLFQLQVIQGSYYRNLSDSNRIRTTIVHAPRGIIFDRNGKPLVYNVPGFRKKEGDKIKVLTNSEAAPLIARGEKGLEVDVLRQYPYKETLAHVLGYIGQISKEELKTDEFSEYRGGDLVGKMGIERQYESYLKGQDEQRLIEVDSAGKEIRQLGQMDAISGRDIKITIDADLQKAAYDAMDGIKKGAIVASTLNGEILAMLSKPSFDSNLFTLGETYKISTTSGYVSVSGVLSDGNNQPFLNRAISGVYPPGSTFKLVVAAAGLQEKIIDEDYRVEDTGVIRSGTYSFSNWFYTGYGRKEGSVDVVKGIKRSNDIFFYRLAEKIGVSEISKWAKKFGLGSPLGIDLDSEVSGLVPDPDWKEREIGEPWYLGDTFIYGIGQGYVLTTPLQVNGWTQAIANKGKLHRPHFLKNAKKQTLTKNLLSEKNFELIKQGMVESCEKGGVAWPFFDFTVKNARLKIDGKNILKASKATTSASFKDYRKIIVACKTGTSQHGGAETLPHSWITLFAPAHNPEIVLTVLAEESGEGSNIAAPIARKVLEQYFSAK